MKVMNLHITCLVGLICSGVFSSTPAALVAHWKVGETAGETSGTTLIEEIGGYNATVVGTPAWESSALAPVPSGTTNAISYGTSGQHNSTFGGVLGTADRSIASWINLKESAKDGEAHAIVAWGENNNGERFTFRVDSGSAHANKLRIEVQGGYATANTALTVGEWVHATVVWGDDGTGVHDARIYLNGVLDGGGAAGWSDTSASNQSINTANAGSDNVTLAGERWRSNANGSLTLDDIRIYDHVLSPGEIAVLIPEPSAILLLATGFVTLGFSVFRKRSL